MSRSLYKSLRAVKSPLDSSPAPAQPQVLEVGNTLNPEQLGIRVSSELPAPSQFSEDVKISAQPAALEGGVVGAPNNDENTELSASLKFGVRAALGTAVLSGLAYGVLDGFNLLKPFLDLIGGVAPAIFIAALVAVVVGVIATALYDKYHANDDVAQAPSHI